MEVNKYKNIIIVIVIFFLFLGISKYKYYLFTDSKRKSKIILDYFTFYFRYYFSNEFSKRKSKIIQDQNTINLVTFYSEGTPHDNGLNLSINKDIIFQQIKHFNNISVYTPKILKKLGLNKYVKEYKKTGLVSMNKGMSKIGFCAWRPKILLLELEKMSEGEILIYRDMNIKKYPNLGNYDNIRNLVLKILDIVNFDFFVSRETNFFQLKQLAKTNIIRELGDDHPFTYNFPNLLCNFLIVRKSKVSIELLKEWENACLEEEWINGEQYGELHSSFRWSCPEQSILGVIIANWVRKRKHGISRYYPLIGFKGRNINNMYLYNIKKDYDYLEYLNIEN